MTRIQEAIEQKIAATEASMKYTREYLQKIKGLIVEEARTGGMEYLDLMLLQEHYESALTQLKFQLFDLEDLRRIAEEGVSDGKEM